MDDNMMKNVEDYITSRIIFEKPVKYIHDCLKLSERNNLRKLGMIYLLEDVEEKGIRKLTEELEMVIPERLESFLSYLNGNLIEKFLEDAQKEELNLEEVEDDIYIFMEYNLFGWLFLFLEEDDILPVIPEEIKEKVKAIDKKVLMDRNALYTKMDRVLRALLNLYGILEEEQFLKIWKGLNYEKISPDELHEFLANHPEEGGEFRIFDGDILHGAFESPVEASYLKDRRKGKKYYVPTELEIDIYETHFANPNTKEYKNLYDYIEKNYSEYQAERALKQLEFFSVSSASQDVEIIFSILADSGVVMENEQEAQLFLDMITPFLNNSPLWENKGHSPQALYDSTVEDMKDIGSGNIIHKDLLQ